MNEEFDPQITYYPARLYEGKEWYVGFYAMDPASGKLKRIKRKINRIKSIKEKRRFGRALVTKINNQLAQGWNPFTHSSSPKSLRTFSEGLNQFLRMKKSELRETTYSQYKSNTRAVRSWLKERSDEDILAVAFDQKMAIDFMNHIWNDISRNPMTYNNYLAWMKGLFSWLMIQQFVPSSPFTTIPPKRRSEKKRTTISKSIRKEIKAYLHEYDPNFLVFCYLVFHCLIRPGEALKLKVRSIDIQNQTIQIPAEVSKTKTSRISTIPNVILNDIEKFVQGQPKQHFLFSLKIKPGKKKSPYVSVQRRWDKMRTVLELSMDYKIYSLRDTGIIQKLQDGISPEEVMKQAGHTSLQTTTIYVNHANPRGSEQVKNQSSNF